MKRSFGILASAIAAVAMLGACQKEQTYMLDNNLLQNVSTAFGTFTVKADYTEPVAEASTKTALVDVDNPYVKWLSTDKINMWEFVDGTENACFQTAQDGTHLSDGGKSATFDITLGGTDPTGNEYCYTAIYPEGAVTENGGIYSFEIPATQTLVNGNFAANADILVGKPEIQNTRISGGYSINVQFKRPGTVVKLTLKGITAGDLISSVKITAPEGQKIAGRCKIDLTTGEVSDKAYENGTNEITLNCGNIEANGDDVLYFRCLDGTWASGSSVSIEVETGVVLYTKTVSLPKDYVFADGGLTKFGFQGMTKKDYKAEAIADVDKVAHEAKSKIDGFNVTDYVKDVAKNNIDNAVYIAKEKINNSTTIAEVNTVRDNTIAKIKSEVERIRPTS